MTDDELRVIGHIEVRASGAPLDLPPQLAKALAVLVATRPGQSVSRAELVDALWPSAPEVDRLSAVLSKLRNLLRRVGLTISAGRGRAGYQLRSLDGQDGAEPADLLDTAAFARHVEKGERLLEGGQPVRALGELRAAAARWRGEPFTVGDDEWELPRRCRAAAERFHAVRRRLVRAWVHTALLTGRHDVLDWVEQDPRLLAALSHDRELWLLRFVAALAAGDAHIAEGMLEQRRPEWGYDDAMTLRCAQLLELYEIGAEFVGQPPRPAPEPGPHHDALAAFVSAIAGAIPGPGGGPEPMRPVGPTGPARAAVLDELVALAAGRGIRVVRAVCDGADDIAPGRQLMRELWAAALTDPLYPPDTHRGLLTAIVASPRPAAGARDASGDVLVDAAVGLLTALARRRPLLVVIDDAHRMTALAAELVARISARVAGLAVGFALPGADSGPLARRGLGSVLTVDALTTPPRPDSTGWLAGAAVTAVDGEIDPVLVAAVLGVPATLADVGLAAALRSGTVTGGDSLRFATPRAHEDVLAELATDPGRLRRLHAAAYRHFAGLPGPRSADPARVARHAIAARPDVTDEEIAAACLRAVVAEQAALRFESAIDFAVRGLALTDDPGLRFELQIGHGDARHAKADMHAAETAWRAAYDEAQGWPRRRARAAVRLARRWMDPGRADPALLHVLTTSRDALDGMTDRESRELWLLLSANLAHWSTLGMLPDAPPGEMPDGVRLARGTLAALGPGTSPDVACEVISECRYALFEFVSPAECRRISARGERIAAGASVYLREEAAMQAIVDDLRLGNLMAARQASERHRALVERTGHGLGPWSQLALDTIFDLWDGDLDAADARLNGPMRAMLDAKPREVSDSMRQTWMAELSWLRLQQDRMLELVDIGLVRLAERRQYFVLWSPAMALMYGLLEQPAAAVDQLAVLLEMTADLRALPPNGLSVPTLWLAAEAVDSLRGHHSERLDIGALVRRLDASLEPHTEEMALAGWPSLLLGPVTRARGLLALASGRPDQALEFFEHGIDKVGPAPAQLGWLRLHRARALLARPTTRRVDQARELLRWSLDTARVRGMGTLRAAVCRELEALGGAVS